jgi:hypothetical protein
MIEDCSIIHPLHVPKHCLIWIPAAVDPALDAGQE